MFTRKSGDEIDRNEYYRYKNHKQNQYFEQWYVVLSSFLNQDKLDVHCASIGIKDSGFHSQFLSYEQCLFQEINPAKKIGQISDDIRGYQDALVDPFSETLSSISTADHSGEKISPQSSKFWDKFTTKLQSLFGVSYCSIHDSALNKRALKPKQDYFFGRL